MWKVYSTAINLTWLWFKTLNTFFRFAFSKFDYFKNYVHGLAAYKMQWMKQQIDLVNIILLIEQYTACLFLFGKFNTAPSNITTDFYWPDF